MLRDHAFFLSLQLLQVALGTRIGRLFVRLVSYLATGL